MVWRQAWFGGGIGLRTGLARRRAPQIARDGNLINLEQMLSIVLRLLIFEHAPIAPRNYLYKPLWIGDTPQGKAYFTSELGMCQLSWPPVYFIDHCGMLVKPDLINSVDGIPSSG